MWFGLKISHRIQTHMTSVSLLKERIWSRVQSWKEKMRKEILIKAVAQAIQTFVMGWFDIIKEICDQISTMIWCIGFDGEKLTKPKGDDELKATSAAPPLL